MPEEVKVMGKKRNNYSAQLKFQVALEAVKGLKTINQIGSEHGVHPNLVSQWKRQLLEAGAGVFSQGASKRRSEQQAQESELYEQIGRLKMELEWLKKKAARFSGG
jgi:transposase-like protein